MIVADTSGLLAFFHRDEPTHAVVRRVVEEQDAPLIVSPYVVAELDYLLATRLGVAAELAVLSELASGAYHLADIDAETLSAVTDVVERYRDQGIGATDASLVVMADRYRTRSILTLDRLHFDVLRPLGGGRFRVLPDRDR